MINIPEYILAKFPGKSFNARGNLHGNCPFHDDHTKSFSINRDGVFICGSTKCGIKGNFAYFYKLSEGVNWHQVKDDLKNIVPQNNLDVKNLFTSQEKVDTDSKVNSWPPNTEEIGTLDYLEQRGFNELETQVLCDRFGLRYGVEGYHEGIDTTATIVVPIYDLDGTYRTFQVRYLDEDKWTRWKNPMNSPLQDILYGGWLVSGKKRFVWVVEGASDVWNLARYGYEAVGLFTKEATYGQMDALYTLSKQYNVHYLVCLDGDAHSQHQAYGKDFCLRLNNEILAFGIPSSIIYLDKHEDPGSLTKERIEELYDFAVK